MCFINFCYICIQKWILFLNGFNWKIVNNLYQYLHAKHKFQTINFNEVIRSHTNIINVLDIFKTISMNVHFYPTYINEFRELSWIICCSEWKMCFYNNFFCCCRWSFWPAAGMDQLGTNGNWSWISNTNIVS